MAIPEKQARQVSIKTFFIFWLPHAIVMNRYFSALSIGCSDFCGRKCVKWYIDLMETGLSVRTGPLHSIKPGTGRNGTQCQRLEVEP